MTGKKPTTIVGVRVEQDLLDAYKAVVESEERDVSKDLRLHIRRRVDKARRDQAKAAAA